MWIIIFGLTLFWEGLAALIAWICGFPVGPVALGAFVLVFLFVTFLFSLANMARQPAMKGE